jgi:hypothetical protein
MEVIGVASGRPPTVDRSQGAPTLFPTFEGTREAKVRDRDMRIRIALAGVQAARLWRLLGQQLSDAEKAGVGGHEILKAGGQKAEHWRPRKLVLARRIPCTASVESRMGRLRRPQGSSWSRIPGIRPV